MSTNKVYGDKPNRLKITELDTRYDYADSADQDGIDESLGIDQNLHSLFGASKAAADLMVQEYGRYFGMRTGVFRGGCLTGARHSAVPLHGFLSYLVRVAANDEPYTILGYKGKQVRDQIASADVISAFEAFCRNPRCGEVYNLGGGRENSASILECMSMLGEMLGRPVRYEYHDQPRVGDHICYISNLAKFRTHYPDWSITQSLPDMMDRMLSAASVLC